MRGYRLLRPDEIEVRIKETKNDYVRLLLYKTVRTDAAILDETHGASNWQNDYREVKGNLQCGIGIKYGDEWIWKWNVGTESNTEAEKGEASDAFKRAGFVIGIGTELYSAPEIKVWANNSDITIKIESGKPRCYDCFYVKSIGYDNRENISSLEIVNAKSGKVVFSYGAHKPAQSAETTPPKPNPQDLKAEITGILDKICETEEQRNIAIATWTKKKDGTCSATVDEISDELLPAVLDKAKKQYKKKTGEDYKVA